MMTDQSYDYFSRNTRSRIFMTLKELKEWKEYALKRIKKYYEQEIAHHKDMLRLENEDKIVQARFAVAHIKQQSSQK